MILVRSQSPFAGPFKLSFAVAATLVLSSCITENKSDAVQGGTVLMNPVAALQAPPPPKNPPPPQPPPPQPPPPQPPPQQPPKPPAPQPPPGPQPPPDNLSCPGPARILLSESWDVFDTAKWSGDGGQTVSGGYFQALPGLTSAAADWIQPRPVKVDNQSSVVFSNRILFTSSTENDFAESGALLFVNADTGFTFQNYVFINVGYTLAPSHVFVELFGSSGGVDFDQFEETSLPYSAAQAFDVTLNVDPGAYRISAGGQAVDTVSLATPLNLLSLFEVGVQDQLGGLIGSIDQTTISKVCRGGPQDPPRDHPSCKGTQPVRTAPACLNRNGYIRAAKAALPNCPHAGLGLRILAGMRESP